MECKNKRGNQAFIKLEPKSWNSHIASSVSSQYSFSAIMKMPQSVEIAIVHDWLTGMRGGEKVLEVLCELFPEATIYTLIHNEGSVSSVIERHPIRTSFLQKFPLKRNKYRSFLPLFPKAIESFDFSDYRLIISVSAAVAKGAIPADGAMHICYCNTPMRYVWDQYEEYFGKGRAGLLTRTAMKWLAPRLRSWDVKTSDRVHAFLANSENVARRIRSAYNRSSDVVYPSVDTDRFQISPENDGSYLVVSALVPYKRIDLAIDACENLGRPLNVVGTGPEMEKLQARAGKHTRFLGWRSDEELAGLYARCRALLFPGVEDFGIVPLEAMSCGKYVVAYGQGGALETVKEPLSGVFFHEQTVESLTDAIRKAEQMSFDPQAIRRQAVRFDRSEFSRHLLSAIQAKVSAFPTLPR